LRQSILRDFAWLGLAVGAVLFALAVGPETGRRKPAPLSPQQVALLAGASNVEPYGPRNAADTVVVFSDYRCPYCGVLYQDVFNDQSNVALILRHAVFEEAGRSLGTQAAIAAECARMQERFHTYSYALFSRRDSLGLLSWVHYAQIARVPDIDSFQRCVSMRSTASHVDHDSQLAKQLAIVETPTAVYQNRLYRGLNAIQSLFQELRR